MGKIYYSIITPKNVEQTAIEFKKNLKKKVKRIKLKNAERGKNQETRETPNVYLVFSPVVSRTGTDIDAALKNIKDNSPTILVVLHHTFDTEAVVSKSSKFAERENMHIVDCLFYEDKGLLACKKNEEAYEEAANWLVTNKKKLRQSRGRSSKKVGASPVVQSSTNEHNRDEHKQETDTSRLRKNKNCVIL